MIYKFKKMISDKNLFLITFLLSFFVAGFLLIGNIDQDFFTFYYVGRGVVEGQDMFRDFADNKGPVLYGFFAILYYIFGNNSQLAVFFGNGIVDAISIFFLFKILSLYGLDLKKISISNILFIFFSVLLYKSFSITYLMGSLYAEQLSMMFLLISLWQFEAKKPFSSGVFFALSFLSRLSFLFFIVVFPAFFLIRNLKKSTLYYFSLGTLITTGVILFYFVITGSINDFINNSIYYSLQNSEATAGIRFPNLLTVSILETRIILVFLLVTLFVTISFFVLKDKKLSVFLVIFYLASFIATNPGGIFYSHHFLQFMVIVFIVFAVFREKILKYAPILMILVTFVVSNYIIYFTVPKHVFEPAIPEALGAQYIVIVPHYPELYFVYDKRAPDRYYFPFYVLDSFNSKPEGDAKRHKSLSKEKLRKTLFMMVEFNPFDKKVSQEYLNKFGSSFHLKREKVYQYGSGKVELYYSKL